MSYVFDANADPNERTRRRKLAEALMLKATDAGPIASPWQGAAKMAQALMGGVELGMYDKQDRLGRESAKADMEAAMGGAGAQTQGASPVAAALASPPSFTQTGGKMAQAPSDLAPYFDEASKMTGIPASVLMAKVQQESRFNPNAIGKAGEVGLAQIMPSTARDPGFGMQGVDPASLRDPRTNIMFGAQYLAARGKAAGVTDWTDRNQVAKALTAYNGGGDPNYASNVMRFLPGGPVSPATAALAGGGGQPTMAGGDTLAPKAPAVPSGLMGAGQDTSAQQAAIMKALQSDYITPAQKQVLLLKYQSLQKDPMQALNMQKTQLDIDAARRAAAKDEVMTPLEVAAKQRDLSKPLIDPTSTQKEYEAAKKEGFTGTLFDFKKAMAEAGSTKLNVTNDMKSETKLSEQQGTGLGKRLNDIADEGAKAQEDAMLYGRFGQLLDGVQTGKKTQTLEAVRQLTGIALDPNTDNVQALNAAIQYLAPRLRVPGSGAQSDRELGNFMASIPGLMNTPGGNKQIMDTLQGMVAYKQRRAEIAQAWQTGDISAKEATSKINALQSPFSPPVKIPADMGPDQVKQKYPSGTRIILPDGTPGVVP